MFTNNEFHEHITEQKISYLVFPSGEIVANDPLCLYEFEPFEKHVTPGQYHVVLYIHHIDDNHRVAFAEIRFLNNILVSYELALTKEQSEQALDTDEYFGYGA